MEEGDNLDSHEGDNLDSHTQVRTQDYQDKPKRRYQMSYYTSLHL